MNLHDEINRLVVELKRRRYEKSRDESNSVELVGPLPKIPIDWSTEGYSEGRCYKCGTHIWYLGEPKLIAVCVDCSSSGLSEDARRLNNL